MNISGFDKRAKQTEIYNNLNNKKKRAMDIFYQKDKNNLSNNNRSLIFDENNLEYKFSNSNSNYNLLNYKESGYPHMSKTKIISDTTITKINLNNNKSNLMKRGGFNDDINNMHNYNFNNKLAARNLGFIGASKKQSKLIFDQNKNIGLFSNYNMNKEKEKKINYKNINKLFDIKETSGNKNHSNVKSCGKNKNSSSAEPKNIQISRSQKNISDDNNTYLNYTRNLTNNNMINKNGYNSIKENMNKSTDELPYLNKTNNNNMNLNKTNLNKTLKDNYIKININNDSINQKSNSAIDNNKQKNSSSQNEIVNQKKVAFTKDKNILNKLDESKSTKENNTNININNDTKNKIDESKLKSLTSREKAYYALSQSMVLGLRDRIFFSRMTEKLRSVTSVKEIQKANDSYVKNKVKELEQKVLDYNNVINTPFIPSKIAMISINLIMEDDEDNFINFIKNNEHIEQKEKNYYDIYVGLLFVLLRENYDEKNKEENNITSLYDKLDKKGYDNFKDYLYEIFISQKNGRQIYNESRIKKFNELFEKLPDLVKYQGEIKNCKFISFSYFLIHELYIYWDKIKEFHEVKNKAQTYIKYLKSKIVNTSK